MKAKDVIEGIEEGFDDNEKIADAVEWVEDAANRLAELEQDNHMQAIKIEKMKVEIDALKAAQTWQPIESAPSDEVLFLHNKAMGLSGVGYLNSYLDYWSWSYSSSPTHWQSLPPAPETAK